MKRIVFITVSDDPEKYQSLIGGLIGRRIMDGFILMKNGGDNSVERGGNKAHS